MSGGSQHNPNGRQSQLGSGWSPLQLQVANFLTRAPQAHMASERGVTWHTPTPPPHLYHVPAPSSPDPLQGLLQLQTMKGAAGNSVFRHTSTPPDLYRHTPTPPDKHLLRHTPSPGDVKAAAAIPPAELYPHLGPTRDKLVRPEDLLAYARGGVDLSLGGSRSAANGAAPSPAPPVPLPSAHPAHPAHPASPALSVRDAPTINSLIARAQPRHTHARVDALLERLVPSPVSPHSVIVHSRAAPTPSPPSSNEDSTDSCGAPPGSKRKRKPERTLRMPSVPPPPATQSTIPTPTTTPAAAVTDPPRATVTPPSESRISPPREPTPPLENGETSHAKRNGPDPPERPPSPRPQELPHARRKTRSDSSETIDDIAAMIASTDQKCDEPSTEVTSEKPMEVETEADAPVTIDKLKSVLASPEPTVPDKPAAIEVRNSPPKTEEKEKPSPETPVVEAAAAPRRRSTRTSNSESTNVPVESPSEAKPAEPEASEARSAEPTAASFVEVENQLEKMFAGIEEEPTANDNAPQVEETTETTEKTQTTKARKRRKSTPAKGESKASRRSSRASTGEEGPKRKTPRKKIGEWERKENCK